MTSFPAPASPLFAASLLAAILAAATLGAQRREETFGPQEPPFRPERPIAIVGGTLIDATGAPPKLDYTVLIEGERITRVAPSSEVSIPEGARTIDASEMTVMPGLVNSNQHIQLNPLYPAPTANLTLEQIQARWEETWSRMPQRAFVYLMQGVTSMRQTSGPAKRILPVKRAIDRGEIEGPRIFLGGALFTSQEHFDHYVETSRTPPEAVEWMRNEFAYNVIDDIEADTDPYLGPDFNYWKLYMSEEIFDGENDFTDEELRRIIEKAHAHGKIVDVHCGGHNDGLRRMVAFDVDTLEHPFYGHELIADDVIAGYVKKGVIVDTLLTVMVAGAEAPPTPTGSTRRSISCLSSPGSIGCSWAIGTRCSRTSGDPTRRGCPSTIAARARERAPIARTPSGSAGLRTTSYRSAG